MRIVEEIFVEIIVVKICIFNDWVLLEVVCVIGDCLIVGYCVGVCVFMCGNGGSVVDV